MTPRALALGLALASGLLSTSVQADTPGPLRTPAPTSTIAPPPPVVTASPDRASALSRTPAAPSEGRPTPAADLPPLSPLGPDVDRPAAAPDRTPEPKVEHLVTEDRSVRIEEERVRSQTTRIVVRSKTGLGSYEIAPADLSRDPSTDTKAGKRIWLQFGF